MHQKELDTFENSKHGEYLAIVSMNQTSVDSWKADEASETEAFNTHSAKIHLTQKSCELDLYKGSNTYFSTVAKTALGLEKTKYICLLL